MSSSCLPTVSATSAGWVEGMDLLSQVGRPEAVVSDEKRLDGRLADGLRIRILTASKVIAVEQGAIARRPEGLAIGCGGSPSTPNAADGMCSRERGAVWVSA